MTTENTEITLTCFGPRYKDEHDEQAFFGWLDKIKCIEEITASGRELYFHIPKSDLNNNDLESLLALFYRYDIPNMEQFQPLVADEYGKLILGNKKSYWYTKVWPRKKKKG